MSRIGIFPLFVNASMQVRPKLLQLYEDHFLSLNDNLTQCIDGMLLGLLPGNKMIFLNYAIL